jgi:hypothetical protein
MPPQYPFDVKHSGSGSAQPCLRRCAYQNFSCKVLASAVLTLPLSHYQEHLVKGLKGSFIATLRSQDERTSVVFCSVENDCNWELEKFPSSVSRMGWEPAKRKLDDPEVLDVIGSFLKIADAAPQCQELDQ